MLTHSYAAKNTPSSSFRIARHQGGIKLLEALTTAEGCYRRRFASEGATVVVTDVNLEAAEVVADGIKAEGGKALAIVADIAQGEPLKS